MKNQIKNKNLIFPWDLKGYVKINPQSKQYIIESLIKKYRFKSEISKSLKVAATL